MKLCILTASAVLALALTGCSGSGMDNPNGGNGNGADAGVAPAKANVSATAIDFGGVDCGGQASDAKSVTIKNEGGAPLTWSVALAQADAFTLAGPTSGTLMGGETASIGVMAKAVSASSKAGTMAQTTLAITTSDPDKAMTSVAISRMAQGATFEVMPSLADFGDLPVHTQAPDVKLTVRNVGNKAAQVSLVASGGDFDAAWAGSPNAAMLDPETDLQGAVARFKPASNKAQNGKISLQVKGAVCGELAEIPVKGVGTNGVAGVSPGTINYGLVDCGTQAVAQQLSVLNSGNAPFNFTATLGKGQASPYQLSASSGTVLAGNQVQIMVTPKGVPQTSATTQNLYGDSLTITTTAIDDKAHVVDLQETAHGAILTLGAGSVAFGPQKVGSSPTQQIKLSNDGNLTAPVTISADAPFTVPSSVNLTGGSSTQLSIGYTPDAKQLGQAASSSLGIATNVTLCGALPSAAPISASSYDRIAQVSAGDSSTCALATSGFMYCWGDNSYGQLGDGTTGSYRMRPYPVSGLNGTLTQLASAAVSACAINSNKQVQCWGANYYGQLGNNTITDSNVAVPVSNLNDATKLAAGRSWVCAVRQGGSVACWGSNYDGQLGNGTTTESHVPGNVSNLVDAISLGGGYSHACAVRTGGVMSCWGSNYYGELGNASTVSTTAPVAVTSLTSVTATAFGLGNHSCAVRQNGNVACWGDNYYGQLGNGSTTAASTFVTVSNIVDATALALGAYHSCALRSGGGVVCWGTGSSGELGNGATSMSTVPVTVANVSANAITGGGSHTCALRSNGTVTCWGYNGYGQLGNGTLTAASTAVDVVGLN
jgi:alpha-tubulin suppressor-like RCC1 family protein